MVNDKTEYEQNNLKTFKQNEKLRFYKNKNPRAEQLNKDHDIFLNKNIKHNEIKNYKNNNDNKEFIPKYNNVNAKEAKINNLYTYNIEINKRKNVSNQIDNGIKNNLIETDIKWNDNKYSSKYNNNYDPIDRKNNFYNENEIFGQHNQRKKVDIQQYKEKSNKHMFESELDNIKYERNLEFKKVEYEKNNIDRKINKLSNDKERKINQYNVSSNNNLLKDKNHFKNNRINSNYNVEYNKEYSKTVKSLKKDILEDSIFSKNNKRYKKIDLTKGCSDYVIKEYETNSNKIDCIKIKKQLKNKGYQIMDIETVKDNINGNIKETNLKVKMNKSNINDFENELINNGYKFNEKKPIDNSKYLKKNINYNKMGYDWKNKFLENTDKKLINKLKNAKTPLEKKLIVNYKSNNFN